MYNELVWKDNFNIGIESIDKEHQRLFRIINRLYRYREEEKDSQWLCKEGIKYFKGHVMKHFSDEEEYMASIGYTGLERHRKIHQSFRDNTLPALERELEQTQYAPNTVDHFLGVCAGWLIGHTLTEDQAITGRQGSQWEDLLSSEEIAAMEKVIVQLMFDMFRLESQVISDAYAGEKFGNGVYCRLVYGNRSDAKRQQILMAFEERLLVETVGRIMGLQSNKLDTMLMNAVRYTGQQFVGRVLENFPESCNYELKEENLLSYEQFQKVFQREKPQISLLFDTGAGYFSYCVIAPHLLEKGVGTPLEADNALIEVERYLSRREEQTGTNARKKILVVDDSPTIRQAMKSLLSAEYEVALAESGVAAIRAITLNRPDLVLLDYEMPVCDGKMTLEMLRSEEAFASIPVIFLTGEGDPEVVRKLLSLKPAGYLLKYLKQKDIKKKINEFFARQKG